MRLDEIRGIQDVMPRAASLWGRRTAVFFRKQSLSFRELADRTSRLTALLRGVALPGDRVALMMENRPEYLQGWFAIPSAGAVTVPINTFLSARSEEHTSELQSLRHLVCR